MADISENTLDTLRSKLNRLVSERKELEPKIQDMITQWDKLNVQIEITRAEIKHVSGEEPYVTIDLSKEEEEEMRQQQ